MLTESIFAEHYGARVRVIPGEDGPLVVVVPMRAGRRRPPPPGRLSDPRRLPGAGRLAQHRDPGGEPTDRGPRRAGSPAGPETGPCARSPSSSCRLAGGAGAGARPGLPRPTPTRVLESSVPAGSSLVDTAPTDTTLDFDEPVTVEPGADPACSTPTGQQITLGPPERGPTPPST